MISVFEETLAVVRNDNEYVPVETTVVDEHLCPVANEYASVQPSGFAIMTAPMPETSDVLVPAQTDAG